MATKTLALVIPFGQPNVTFQTVLDGRRFRGTILYTPRRVGEEGLEPADPADPRAPRRELGSFRLTLADATGAPVLAGVRLTLGTDRLRIYKHLTSVPQGSLDLVAAADPDLDPTRGFSTDDPGDAETPPGDPTSGVDVGVRVVVRYVPVADLTA